MFELDVAKRHVVTNRRGTAFTLISVTIAVAIIIMSLGLTEGVRMQIIENTVEKNPHLIINPKEGENYIWMYRTLSASIGKYPGVVAVSPRLVAQGGAQFMDEVEGVEFAGVDPFLEDRLMAVQESMTYGNFSDLRFTKNGAVLGVKLAGNLGIRPGGDFYLTLKNRTIRLKVIGLIEKGTVKDSTLVYIPLETAQRLVGQGDVVSEIGVKLSDFEEAPGLALERNSQSR
ncbi:MAG TPA: ABC transporter permease, partial [Methanotrichaceae archaeon]|nr:ABC transporter permease [Methanotrichaceae archaeon]